MVLKKIKRGIVGLLAASLLISAAACGGGDKDDAEETEAPQETTAAEETVAEETEAAGEAVTISIAARGGSHVDAIESVKADFEAEHNCKIEVAGYEAADLKKNIMLDSTKSTGNFDLVMADDPWMPEFTEAQIFLNLTEAGLKRTVTWSNSVSISAKFLMAKAINTHCLSRVTSCFCSTTKISSVMFRRTGMQYSLQPNRHRQTAI